MSDPHTPTLMFRVAVPLFKRKQSKGSSSNTVVIITRAEGCVAAT